MELTVIRKTGQNKAIRRKNWKLLTVSRKKISAPPKSLKNPCPDFLCLTLVVCYISLPMSLSYHPGNYGPKTLNFFKLWKFMFNV